jgi:alcohol dehydrogenase class IV
MFSTWSSPNPILYGSGTSKAVGEQLKKFGCGKVLVVFDKGVAGSRIVRQNPWVHKKRWD